MRRTLREPAEAPRRSILNKVSGGLARSILFRRARALWRKSLENWQLPLNKRENAMVGVYLILDRYSQGKFPPTFEDQQPTHLNEIDFMRSLPGVSAKEAAESAMRKPFWFGRQGREYRRSFELLCRALERLEIEPPARVLELGSGTGWTARQQA